MFFQHRAFWLAKDVQHADGYQDAQAADPVRGMAAIADGVSSSLFAASWASLLVEAVVNDAPNIADAEDLGGWLTEQRQRWREPIDVEKLAWHQKPKFAEGAFTTLLWVQIDPGSGDEFSFTCYSLGDCCLFHVRDDQVLRAFPFESSKLFDTRPKMVGSTPRRPEPVLEFDLLQDACQTGDLLVLCTDALAMWALEQLEAGKSPAWEATWKSSPDQWSANIQQLRESQAIRYDDTTALLLRIGEDRATSTQRSSGTALVDEVKKGLSSVFSGK